MRILTICAEYAPLAKIGGLADVTAGLCSWLTGRGHDVVVVLPFYGVMQERDVIRRELAFGAKIVTGEGTAEYSVYRIAYGQAEDRSPAVYAVDCPQYFGAGIYADGESEAHRFLVLSHAAVRLAPALGFAADIVHCHDWHAAPAILLLQEMRTTESVYRNSYAVLTIHNIGYQGLFDADVLEGDSAGLRSLFSRDDLALGEVNFLKAAIANADALTTVSPTHAREIQTPAYGMGLDGLLRQRRHRLAGILNGIDCRHWNPENDPLLPSTYALSAMDGKRTCRRALLDAFGLQASDDIPVVGVVSRLAQQKGIDLLIGALDELRGVPMVCAILGDGDPALSGAIGDLARRFSGRIGLIARQDEALAHLVIAGSDVLLVPSRYEPCGLTQLYAMRYGTVPVVRETGGLADTVTHFDPATGQGTGVLFRDADIGGVKWGLTTALDAFGDKALWHELVRNGMTQDFSWNRQGPHYEALFSRLIAA